MREIIIDIPLEKIVYDEKLFEYPSFRKSPKVKEVYQGKLKSAFSSNFISNKPIFSPQNISKKNVVIKNIGNMKKVHLESALNYTIEKSFQKYFDLFGDRDENSLMELLENDTPTAIDYLGEFVTAKDILRDWSKDFSKNKNANEALHLVFSLNEVKTPTLMNILLEATRSTMQSNFFEYKYVLVPHGHQNQPHIHIIVNKTNIFSGKKLHFSSKEECASFFNALREDFKQNLYVLSNGKLDYTNEVRFDKNFRQEHLENKFRILEDMDLSQDTSDYEQSIAFLENYKTAISNIDIRLRHYGNENKDLREEIKSKSFYLRNVEKKILELKDKGLNLENLNNKKIELLLTLSSLKKRYDTNLAKQEELKQGIKHFLDWEENYQSFCKNFDLYNKKKFFISTFKGYEAYLSRDLAEKITQYKRDIKDFEKTLAQKSTKIDEGIIEGVSKVSNKTNIFILKKNISKLNHYRKIISTIAFSGNQSMQDKKNERAKVLDETLDILLDQVLRRIAFVNKTLTDSKREYEAYKKNMPKTLGDDIILDKKLVSLEKKISFLSKEFKVGKIILDKHNIALPVEISNVSDSSVSSVSEIQGSLKDITPQVQELQEITSNELPKVKNQGIITTSHNNGAKI